MLNMTDLDQALLLNWRKLFNPTPIHKERTANKVCVYAHAHTCKDLCVCVCVCIIYVYTQT